MSHSWKKGFTVLEFILVAVILIVLAAVAIPVFVTLQSEANLASEKGVVGAVRAGIVSYYMDAARGNRTHYPVVLDSVADATKASQTTPLFTAVLVPAGITTGWKKEKGSKYSGPTGTEYAYDSANGNFS